MQTYYHKSDYLSLLDEKNIEPVSLSSPYSLIILNSSESSFYLIKKLWNHATFRVCADGGANHLYNSCAQQNEEKLKFIPDFIVGDFDSIDPDIKAFYGSKGSTILHSEDQDTTDLEKSLNLTYERVNQEYQKTTGEDSVSSETSSSSPTQSNRPIHRAIIIGGFNGTRMDHELALFHAMLCFSRFDEEQEPNELHHVDFRVILVSAHNSSFFLKKGINLIAPMPQEGRTCGLFPIGGRVQPIESRGLHWDLPSGSALEYGRLISSSNFIQNREEVSFTTSGSVLWTCSHTTS